MCKIYNHKNHDIFWLLQHFLSPKVNDRIWTLNLKIMSWVFDHCAAANDKLFLNSKNYEGNVK
jgi:hypothetical protein